jgi:carbon storage regulator
MIGDETEVTVLAVQGEKVRLGIQAPAEVPVHRTEIYLAIRSEHETRGQQTGVGPRPDDAPSGLEG